jgi:hypothetical protein
MELDSVDCFRHVMAIPGVLGVSLIDYASGLVIGTAGRLPSDDAHATGTGVTDMVTAALHTAAFTETGTVARFDDLVLTAGNGYHLVFFLGDRPDTPLGLYVWLDRALGNLAMTQRRVHTLVPELLPA